MVDVFVSYKSEDRRRVQPLVTALEADGLSVWWDAHIEGGAGWRQSIQQALDAARCVLVVWTRRSAGEEGRFVHDEATRAQRRGVYLPVRLDAVEPPLGFGEVQALSLTGWRTDRADPRYQSLLADIWATIERKPRAARSTGAAASGLDRRHVLAGGGMLALGAAGAGAWLLLKPGSAAARGIAVLPFANLSGDPAQKYFSDGLAEELRGALSRVGKLKVIGRTSSEAVRDEDATEAGRRLGVGNVLTGSVRRSSEMIRVSAQLIDGSDGAQRWTETYDRPVGDALAVQADIAENVARALSVTLGQAERRALTAGGTKNAAAQDLYLKARSEFASASSEPAMRRAIGLLDAALALDPNFAEAAVRKSNFLVDVTNQYASDEAAVTSGFAQAEAAAKLALGIVPDLAAAFSALGNTARARLDGSTALAMFERGRSLGGNDAATLSNFGVFLAYLGRREESVRLAEQAVALDPLDPVSQDRRANVLRFARRYPDAIASAHQALQLAPQRQLALVRIADSLLLLGRPQEALVEYAKSTDDEFVRLTGQAIAYAKLGNRAASDRAFARLREIGEDTGHYQYAEVHAQRDEIDEAFASLDLAWKFRDPGLMQVRGDPFVDPLRRDPRLAAIERRLRLP